MEARSREYWLSKFNNYDKDQDGVIRPSECAKLMLYIGLDPKEESVESFMNRVDKDDNEEIDFEEFYAYIKTLKDPMGELLDQFNYFDSNGDGTIDKEELQAIMGRIQLSPSQLDDMFKMLDENQDGKIQYSEYVAVYSTYQGQAEDHPDKKGGKSSKKAEDKSSKGLTATRPGKAQHKGADNTKDIAKGVKKLSVNDSSSSKTSKKGPPSKMTSF